MEFTRKAVKIGNSSGVILPKKLLGADVKVIVVKKPFELKKEVMKHLESKLENILGVYILNKNPAEVLAISESIKYTVEVDSLKLNIVPLSLIKKDLKTNPLLFRKLVKAETIVNPMLLQEILKENAKK